MTVEEVKAWLEDFSDDCECEITGEIIVRDLDGIPHIFTAEGD